MSDRYSSIVSPWLPRGMYGAQRRNRLNILPCFTLSVFAIPLREGQLETPNTNLRRLSNGEFFWGLLINNARIDIGAFYIRESHVIESNVSSLKDVTFEV